MISKCKHCAQCEKRTHIRTDRKGNKTTITYCKEQEAVFQLSNWVERSKGKYLGMTRRLSDEELAELQKYFPAIESKQPYFTSFFKEDPLLQTDHINGDKTDNCLDNLYECSVVQNTQNRHDRNGSYFHNVKANGNNTYTSFKIKDGKYTKIATCNTDIEAYDKFVKYCRNNGIGINPNTASWQTYAALKSQIPYLKDGVLHG